MTAVEYLFETLWDCPKDKFTWYSILEKAKEMEKQQIELAVQHGHDINPSDRSYKWCGIEYYNETYGSNGSDELKENHIVDTNKMVSSQTEISDEEIQQGIADRWDGYVPSTWFSAFEEGAKWYREQLKKKVI